MLYKAVLFHYQIWAFAKVYKILQRAQYKLLSVPNKNSDASDKAVGIGRKRVTQPWL